MNTLPATKLLFLDTNALVKRFVDEPGHDVIMWLFSNNAVLEFSVHLMTSTNVRDEFGRTIAKMVAGRQISEGEARGVMARSRGYIGLENSGLRIVDTGPLPGFQRGDDTSLEELIKKHDLHECDRTDCAIMTSIVNYLRCFGGGSLPHVVTSDKDFSKVVKREGFGKINPEKITIDELKEYLISLG